jgi:hypothetical protein
LLGESKTVFVADGECVIGCMSCRPCDALSKRRHSHALILKLVWDWRRVYSEIPLILLELCEVGDSLGCSRRFLQERVASCVGPLLLHGLSVHRDFHFRRVYLAALDASATATTYHSEA